ncbi:hypothetical protein K1719_034902 [Acacia pycnantha]|nr:hypothetical protein K1719_034902 [Acacia pycnantha]
MHMETMCLKVDASGKIDFSNLLKLIAGFGENASLYVLFEDKIVFEQEFSTVRRKMRIASKLPDICIAGSQLINIVFEVVDPDGDVDLNIHHNDKDGQMTWRMVQQVLPEVIEAALQSQNILSVHKEVKHWKMRTNDCRSL